MKRHRYQPVWNDPGSTRAHWTAALVCALLVSSAPSAMAWGSTAHRLVHSRAIDVLPGTLKDFYKRHRLELPTLSPEATASEEGPERRFTLDRLLPFPFVEFPRTEEGFRSRFGDSAGSVGRLPWLIQESYARLVERFRSGDKTAILEESDTLASLVTDIHNPLALTDNSDGQKTGQHGLWVRFSVRLPEAAESRLKLDADAAHLLDDPKEFGFSMMNNTYVWLDNILYEEELARRGKSGYTEIYYEDLVERLGGIVRDRLSLAARHVSSYWYTAWTAAGKPALRSQS